MRLLIVEDEKRLAASLAKGLKAQGFAVDVVHDGIAGLHRAAMAPYDLIVLGVLLPGLNGYRVCARLRAAGDDVPILMLTRKDGEYDEAEGLDTGADDYLTRPFSFVVLVARIKALLRYRAGRTRAALALGDLRVDAVARRVLRAGAEIPLTKKEFSVLEQLALHPGEVVSKAEILDYAWDFAYESGDPNIVEVYVSALRRKLGPGLIHTVRGAGYRLEAR
ncbi:response regulator transcription factor [Streptomyces sp. A7024]|uniref:Response regulator transcription factor n=1 Tax=Streptomyces coryli TaxID=1128680 RepID=A0A6G4TYF8_9ACTN|nr:response regulator transcription factor [Streptomyces coryli]NGN64924.1 response regulator transcription factor [Streptomyces coryli]